mgnify:CR=1 FL=1
MSLAGIVAILTALGGVALWAWRALTRRKIARLEAERDQQRGRADVAVKTHEATVIVDDRQAAAREVADEARPDPAVVAATTPAERVDAATDLLRHGHGMDANTASKRAGDRVRAKIVTAKRKP